MPSDAYPYEDWDRPEVLPFVPAAKRYLDIGCSYGGFGRLLKSRSDDIEVWGIEPDPRPAGVAATRLDRVIIGSYPDALPPGESFDCVIFNDVLEHMTDPWSALRRTLAILRPSGCVVASIPNVRFGPVISNLAVRGKWTYTRTGVLDRTHLRFFTRSSMQDMFRESGYEVRGVHPIRPLQRGRIALIAKVFGRLATEFVVPNFVVVANAADTEPPRNSL